VLCRRQVQSVLQAPRVLRLVDPVNDVKRPTITAVHAETDQVLHLNSCCSQLPFRHSSVCKQTNAYTWQLLGHQTRTLRGQSMRTSRSHRGTERYQMTLAASQKPQSRADPRNAASSSCKVPSGAFILVCIALKSQGSYATPPPPWALSMLPVSTRRGRTSRRPRVLGRGVAGGLGLLQRCELPCQLTASVVDRSSWVLCTASSVALRITGTAVSMLSDRAAYEAADRRGC